MPLIRFLGFPDGETVSLGAAQSGLSDSASQGDWNVIPEVAIEVTRSNTDARFAPEAIWFEAHPSNFGTSPAPAASIAYDPEFHEIEYVWDFGDPGDVFAAPQNVPDFFRDANSATGQITSHVYRQPGTYTVTCTARRVVDPDKMELEEAVGTFEIVVGDADTRWSAANTIVVALDGDFTGAPASDYQATRTENDFWWTKPDHWARALNDVPDGGAVRVLFKRGEDYSEFNNGFAHGNDASQGNFHQFVYFGAWGTGDAPISGPVNLTGLNGGAMVWDGVQILDDYDDVTQTGSSDTLWQTRGGGYALITNCTMRGGGGGVLSNGGSPAINGSSDPMWLSIHDTTISSVATYGLFIDARADNYDGLGGRDRVAQIGCLDIDAGTAPHSGTNRQGPVRTAGREDLLLIGNEYYSRFGFTGQGAWPADGVSATAEQPCLRLFQAGQPEEGTERNGRVVVSRCTGEGSEFFSAASLFENPPPVGNLVVDQVIHVGSASCTAFAFFEMGAVTIRNSLWIKPDVPDAFGLNTLFAVELSPHDSALTWDQAARQAEPIALYGNSFMVLGASDLVLGPFSAIDSFDTYSETNSLTYMPANPSNPRHEDFAPFDSTKLWTLRYEGRLEASDNGILQTQYAPPDGSASLYQPLPGSPVIGTAVGALPVVDLLGRPRAATRSRGALEPE